MTEKATKDTQDGVTYQKVIKIISNHIYPYLGYDQMGIIIALYADCPGIRYIGKSWACRWIRGGRADGRYILDYYAAPKKWEELKHSIGATIIPALDDSDMVVQQLHHLLARDNGLPVEMGTYWPAHYPCHSDADRAACIAVAVYYTMYHRRVA